MNAIYASLICVAGALICCILRPTRPELATGVALAAGTAALMTGMGDLRQAVGQVSQIAQTAGLESAHWQTLMKACGLSLIGEFAGQICADAGESALAGRIRLALRLALLALAAPLMAEVFSGCVSLIG
ncbi:MAG: hypothetical protein MR620_09325 [Clostridiales bacterium]|nr:hypothetical protein [Clostridiales bacterium]